MFQRATDRGGGLMRTAISLLILAGGLAEPALAQPISVSIDTRSTAEPVTRYEYGMFIEPIGGLIARTLWAEMLDDRKFYFPVVAAGKDPPVPRSVEGRPGVEYRKWRPVGGDDAVVMDSRDCYVGSQSPRVALNGSAILGLGQGGIGIAKSRTYSGHIVLRGDPAAKVAVALIWGTAAENRRSVAFPALGAGWQSYPFELVAGADSTDARLEITGTGTGSFWIGTVSLMPADNINGWRADTTSILRALHSGFWRLPGGNFLSNWDWHSALGPRDRRAPMFDHAWSAMQPNDLGMDESADWMQYLTADAASAGGKARAANGHPAPYKVAMLGLGNESWDCGGHMSAAEYTFQLKEYAKFVHNWNKEQAIQRVAVGPGGPKTDYTTAVMQTWKENKDWDWDMEGMSLHSYTVGHWPPSWPAVEFGEQEYALVLNETLKMDELIRTHAAIMDQYDPQKKISLVVDEWGAWLAPTKGSNPSFLQQQNSLRDAVLAALNLNIFARHADRVRNANIAQMINVLQALLLTDGPKMVRTPTYHVFRMYVPFQDATVLPVAYDAGSYRVGDSALPRVDVIAARTRDGKIVLALTNVDAQRPAAFDISVGQVSTGTMEGETLSAPRVNAINTLENPGAVTPKPVAARVRNGRISLQVPPASVTVVTVAGGS